jgi:4-hydroxybenzoate polyprenyltransferase
MPNKIIKKHYNTILPYLQLMRWEKPIGIFLLLYPTLWALILTNNKSNYLDYFIFIFGVIITRSAGCVINDILDRNIDKYVSRTKSRPLAVGSINLKSAIILLLSLKIVALSLAIFYLKIAVILMALFAGVLYSTYPLFKRFFAIPQAYLAICFSFSILMVFMQIDDKIPNIAILIFFANIFWVIGYDTIYAMVDKEDDIIVGIKTSAVTFGDNVKLYVSGFYSLFIIILIMLGIQYHYNLLYFICLFISFILLLKQVIILFKHNDKLYFKMFLSNMWVGFFITLAIILRQS